MPQMSPMDWLILSMFFLFIYFLSFMIIYFMYSLNFKKLNLNLSEKSNYFYLNW